MINIRYNKDDLRYIFLYGDPGELKELEAYLNKIPQYQFMPSFKGIPKPEVFLFKFKKNDHVYYYTFAGMWKCITDWCKIKNIQCDTLDSYFKYTDFPMSRTEFWDYISQWGLNIDPRDYQVEASWLILKYRQSLSQLATRAGKTLIAYIVFRYMLEHGAHNILMIVPNTTLVKQAYNDMKEYQEFFRQETVWFKGEVCEGSNLTIGTFQSLVRRLDRKSKHYNPKFFDKFDIVCCDEAHTSKCESIKQILNQQFMKHVKLRFGFSGSLPNVNTIESFATQSLLGPTIQNLTAKELIDKGFLAKPIIWQIRIQHELNDQLMQDYIKCGEYLNSITKVTKEIVNGKLVKKKVMLPKEEQEFTIKEAKVLPMALSELKLQYEDNEYMQYLIDLCKARGANLLMLEQMLVHRSKKRIDIMDNLIMSFDKNCIVFAHHSEYMNYLKSHFEKRFPDRKVYLIKGNTTVKNREKIIKALETDKQAILVASYQCVGTGLTLKNMDYCIFAQSFKSSIINKQSLGRMMLKTNEKDKFYLYDLVDVFPSKKLYVQGLAKIRLYDKEGFESHVCKK